MGAKALARKKTAPSAGSRLNPLQRMFGTFLRLERKRLHLDSGFVSQGLALTETFYRLVEAGRAPFNQSLAFRLIGLFSNATARDQATAQIHFSRLALYLVGTQWVSGAMTPLGKNKHADLMAVEALAANDADFELFHLRTKDYYALREGDKQQKQFLENTAAPCVANFLGAVDYARPTKHSIIESVMPSATLLALPTLNVEMVSRLLQDLAGRPFVHTQALAAQWEDRAAPTIRAIHGIYDHPSRILCSDNLEHFRYHYLREPRFGKLRFLFLEAGDETASSLRAAFIRTLNIERKKANFEPIEDKQSQKITFATLTNAQREQYSDQLAQLLTAGTPDGQTSRRKAYWSFDTTTNIPIGFVGGDGPTWNLSLGESADKNGEFEKFWYDLQ
jgi:hypothetical protein